MWYVPAKITSKLHLIIISEEFEFSRDRWKAQKVELLSFWWFIFIKVHPLNLEAKQRNSPQFTEQNSFDFGQTLAIEFW